MQRPLLWTPSSIFSRSMARALPAPRAGPKRRLPLAGFSECFCDGALSGLEDPYRKSAPNNFLVEAAALGMASKSALVTEDNDTPVTHRVLRAAVYNYCVGGPTSASPELLLVAGAVLVFSSVDKLPEYASKGYARAPKKAGSHSTGGLCLPRIFWKPPSCTGECTGPSMVS